MSSPEEPRASGSRSRRDVQSQVLNAGKKRGRYENMEDLFAGSTPEEIEKQTAQYRDLLSRAEGMSAGLFCGFKELKMQRPRWTWRIEASKISEMP